MRQFGSYALIATYLVVQLFGQVIHAWSGCEHAHLPGNFHSHVAAADDHHGHHHHDHGHRHDGQHHAEPVSHNVPGWHTGEHSHGVAIDGCLLCHHLALGQLAPTYAAATIDRVALSEIVPQSITLVTTKRLGPNSPRAPPVA